MCHVYKLRNDRTLLWSVMKGNSFEMAVEEEN